MNKINTSIKKQINKLLIKKKINKLKNLKNYKIKINKLINKTKD